MLNKIKHVYTCVHFLGYIMNVSSCVHVPLHVRGGSDGPATLAMAGPLFWPNVVGVVMRTLSRVLS